MEDSLAGGYSGARSLVDRPCNHEGAQDQEKAPVFRSGGTHEGGKQLQSEHRRWEQMFLIQKVPPDLSTELCEDIVLFMAKVEPCGHTGLCKPPRSSSPSFPRMSLVTGPFPKRSKVRWDDREGSNGDAEHTASLPELVNYRYDAEDMDTGTATL